MAVPLVPVPVPASPYVAQCGATVIVPQIISVHAPMLPFALQLHVLQPSYQLTQPDGHAAVSVLTATHDAAVVAPPPAHPAAVHVPAGHSTHPPIPTSAPYFPAGHSAHPTTPVAAAAAVTAVLALAACALYMPTAHAVQNAAPATALNRPASHATQPEPVAAVAVR